MKVTIAKNRENKISEKLGAVVAEGLISWLLSTGLLLSFLSLFQIECDWTMVFVGAFAASLLCALCSKWKFGVAAAACVMVVFAGITAFLTSGYLANGFYHLYNLAADWMGNHTSIVLPLYELLVEESAFRDMEMLLGITAAFLGLVSYSLLKTGRFLFVFLWIPVALLSFCVDNGGNIYGKILLVSGVIGMLLYCSYFGRKKIWMENGYRLMLLACLFVFLLAGVLFGTVHFMYPADEYESPVFVTKIQEQIKEYAVEIRFGKADVNTLPKGNLNKAHIWEGSDKTALKVTMEQPESMYLRGFVGSVYEDNQWRDLDYSVYYEKKDLFYWLHEDGFYGDAQISGLRKLLVDTDLSEDIFQVEVENVAADREYLYTTYEMLDLEAETAWNNGDSYQKSKEFFGTVKYGFSTYGNLIKDFPQMAAEGYLYKAKHDEDAYMEAESHYNVFVYDNYTELPAGMNAYFKQELGYAGEKEKGHVNYYSAIQKIRTYLEKHMTCGNYGEELPEGEDFAEYFLKESKIGNPVHFATAAALMFRYYGIPSRYVEGYFITPKDVEGLGADATIAVAGKNGHAWVEIYVDGLGWVPVEMTPDYYEVMEEPDFTKGLEADSTVVIQEPEEKEEEPDVIEESDLKYKLAGFFIDLAKILLILLLVFDGFCILFFLYSLIRRFFVNAKRKKAFKNPEHRLAVQSMTGYMVRIMAELDEIQEVAFTECESENCTKGIEKWETWKEMKSEYEAAYRIGEKAAFSLHEITKEERQQVEACKNNLLTALKKQKGWFEKWVLKYIERLY